jgi:hypothetical protein
MNEAAAVMACRGRWSEPGLPHKGWTCTNVEDLEDLIGSCEMCNTDIRYVHHMEHPDYPEALGVGCICAGHMEQNYEAARDRQREAEKATARRRRAAKRAAEEALRRAEAEARAREWQAELAEWRRRRKAAELADWERRREAWPGRPGWRPSQRNPDNLVLYVGGVYVTVMPSRYAAGAYGVAVHGNFQWGFRSLDAAKLHAFDVLYPRPGG